MRLFLYTLLVVVACALVFGVARVVALDLAGGSNSAVSATGIGGTVADSAGADGVVNVKNYGAKGDGKVYADGAMASTSTTLTSAGATFTSADAGKLICVDGAGAAGVDLCGTIQSVGGANTVTLSFANVSGGAISSKEFAYATNDDAAFAAAFPAACGSILFVPAGIYGRTVGDVWCTTKGTILQGAGSGRLNWGYSGNGKTPQSALIWLTKSMTASGTQQNRLGDAENIGYAVPATIEVSSAFYACCGAVIRDITLWATVGLHRDGGGSGINGVYSYFIGRLEMENVDLGGFGGDCINIFQSWMSTFHFLRPQSCGNRGLIVNGGQNVRVTDTDVEDNWSTGLVLGSVNFVAENDTLARNNVSETNPGYEMSVVGARKGLVTGSYFEPSHANTTPIAPGAGNASTAFINNQTTANDYPAFNAASNPLPSCATASPTDLREQQPVCASDSNECTSGTTYSGGGAVPCLVQCYPTSSCTAASTPKSCCTGNGTGCGWVETGAGCW